MQTTYKVYWATTKINIAIHHSFSTKHAALRSKDTEWLWIGITCLNGATCLPSPCLQLMHCYRISLCKIRGYTAYLYYGSLVRGLLKMLKIVYLIITFTLIFNFCYIIFFIAGPQPILPRPSSLQTYALIPIQNVGNSSRQSPNVIMPMSSSQESSSSTASESMNQSFCLDAQYVNWQ